MLKIYNTLTHQKEAFHPLNPGTVNMYVCGPTVYDRIHIGNARSIVAFDTVRRYLEFCGFQVNYVSNFTDVDDKMIEAAAREKITVSKLAQRYIDAYNEDTNALNVKPATISPRATENIEAIISLISKLITNGYAYQSAGNVYYRARKFSNYGQLSGQSLNDLEVGASEHISSDEVSEKEDPLDFALWKAAKPSEVKWSSPWGDGRPGWHIECSAMAIKYLGNTLDIHAGGQDLEFPHHENEIAQSEAVTGHHFVNYWMHNGFVTLGEDAEKMSKSLGNVVTVHDLISKVDPQVLRFFMSTIHYRRPIRYSKDSLVEAQVNLDHLRNTYNNLNFCLKDAASGADGKIEAEIAAFRDRFIIAMDNDINVQNGVMVIYELVRFANQYMKTAIIRREELIAIKMLLKELMSIFGVQLVSASEINDAGVRELIAKRDRARAERNFALSDQIRDKLKKQGILLEDTPWGTRYRRE